MSITEQELDSAPTGRDPSPHWAAVPFPREAEEKNSRSGRAYSDAKPVMVPSELVEDLSIEALVTFVRLTLWHQRREQATMGRLADELWFGEIQRAAMWVAELQRRGLVVTSSHYRTLLEELYPDMYEQRLTREEHEKADAERADRRRAKQEAQAASRAERERATQEARKAARERYLPTEPDGSWAGPWPLNDHPRPPRGQDIVYVLYGEHNRAVYVGSTDNFSVRTKAHQASGKQWNSWIAIPCEDRAEAYAVEGEYLAEYMPHLNVQGPQFRRGDA